MNYGYDPDYNTQAMSMNYGYYPDYYNTQAVAPMWNYADENAGDDLSSVNTQQFWGFPFFGVPFFGTPFFGGPFFGRPFFGRPFFRPFPFI